VVTVEPEQTGERRVTLRREAQLPFIILGYPAPNWESDDAPALVVLSKILFDGKRSRIYQRLTYNDQSAVDAGGDYDPISTDHSLFYFHAMVAPNSNPADVESAIYEEVERLRSAPPQARELERAKNQVEASYLFAQDSVFYQAMRLGEAEAVGAGADYVTAFPKRIRQVSAEDVMRVAHKYLLPEHRTVALMQPTSRAQADGEGGS